MFSFITHAIDNQVHVKNIGDYEIIADILTTADTSKIVTIKAHEEEWIHLGNTCAKNIIFWPPGWWNRLPYGRPQIPRKRSPFYWGWELRTNQCVANFLLRGDNFGIHPLGIPTEAALAPEYKKFNAVYLYIPNNNGDSFRLIIDQKGNPADAATVIEDLVPHFSVAKPMRGSQEGEFGKRWLHRRDRETYWEGTYPPADHLFLYVPRYRYDRNEFLRINRSSRPGFATITSLPSADEITNFLQDKGYKIVPCAAQGLN
jgi:hypothetical protein